MRDGAALWCGSLFWPRSRFPTLAERAELLAGVMPSWSIASSHTAGWVWTGIGTPEPWVVLRRPQPAPSPLERTVWKARTFNPRRHHAIDMGRLSLLSRADTVTELLLGDTPLDIASTQIALLTGEDLASLRAKILAIRSNGAQKRRSEEILARVANLRVRYPDITL